MVDYNIYEIENKTTSYNIDDTRTKLLFFAQYFKLWPWSCSFFVMAMSNFANASFSIFKNKLGIILV